MKEKNENRAKRLIVRLNAKEHEKFEKRFKKTRYSSLSEYIRDVLLNKPVTVYHRDQSMDDMLEELIRLRTELNFIGINFNQAVRKLNSVSGMPDAAKWQNMLTILRDELEPSIGSIKDRMNTYADIWSDAASNLTKTASID